MRVLLFSHAPMPPLYGTEHVVDALGRGLTSLGVETTLVCCGAQESLHGFSTPYRLVVLKRGKIRFLRRRSLKRQLAGVLSEGFHIVHGHGARPEGQWLLEMSNRHKAPVIITCHRPIRKKQTQKGRSRFGSQRRLERRRQALVRADAVIAVSRNMKASIASFCGSMDHLHLIPNGVWPEDYKEGCSPLPKGLDAGSYILGMGRLAHEKGFDLLVRAFARAFKDHKEAVLVLAGEGPDEGRLRDLAHGLGISDRLRLLGYVRGEEKTALLRGCSFLVVPSRIPEAFGLIILEAFSSGRTVIGAEIGGIPDMVREGENGLLFQAESHEELAEKIERLYNDHHLRNRLEKSAKGTVDDYSWNMICQRHLDLYRACLEAKDRR